MPEKKPGAKLEDFLSPEEINACRAAQQLALPLLPSLSKIPKIIDDIAELKSGAIKMDHRLNDSLTASDLARELAHFEEAVQAKFEKMITSNLETNNSISDLTININKLCSQIDVSTRDYVKLEERLSSTEAKQQRIMIDIASQKASISTSQRFLPTVATILSIIAVAISLYINIAGK